MFSIRPIGEIKNVLDVARGFSPYIERLLRRYPEISDEIANYPIKTNIENILQRVKTAANLDLNNAIRELRIAKSKTHAFLSAADLSGTLPLMEITGALSALADNAIETSLILAQNDAPDRDKAAFKDGKAPGLFILAMGKHGAGELNYSSDIDLSAFFDREAFHEDHHYSATAICVRLIGAVSRIMEEITIDNYVFRVDWRLRPDPASTPLAVSTQSAETYYESVGQNWERAAFIKARAIAGSMVHADEFLNQLQPFIWRKYLDFAAVLDVGSILRQIHRHNKSGEYDDPAFDVKLGRGGIREIEFFTQTQQLILGGKDRTLRKSKTLDALTALKEAGRIDENVRAQLSNAYEFLRNIEHRVQMLEDEQTHSLPAIIEKRAKIAALSGFADLADFDKNIKMVRECVRDNISGLFPQTAPLASTGGSLVFTGVEDDEETLETITALGFKDAARVSQTIRGWHHGRIRATRTPRAREILTAITPDLLNAIASTEEADVVFARFDDFLSGLSASVQTLALFQTEPEILKETCLTFALSARLARDLSKKPAILDAMLTPRFFEPLRETGLEEVSQIAANMLENCTEFEFALDIIRRFHREEAFRIGYHILHSRAKFDEAAYSYSNLAIACIRALLPFAKAEVVRIHGEFNGEIAVCGWGKLGGLELAADSDLDLMIVYDPDPQTDYSNGPRELSAETYFAKITQKLINALSVETAEGPLYEVDMQLRPSGKKGPVAVRFSSFENYYQSEAWTWEFQALTRLMPIAGDNGLCERIKATKVRHLQSLSNLDKVAFDIIDMRQKIRDNHKPRGDWDLKRLEGGIVDLEFIAQYYQLLNGGKNEDVYDANTLASVEKLSGARIITGELATRLIHAGRALSKTRQILSIIAGPDFDAKTATNSTRHAIARALNEPDFSMADAALKEAREIIFSHWCEICEKHRIRATEK